MIRLHYLNDCAETEKTLNESIQQLFTLHYSLSTQ